MEYPITRRALAAVLCCSVVALAALSCHNPFRPPKGPGLRIDVDSTQATVTWNGRYRVDKLIVFGSAMWFIVDEEGLTPPVTYRETPPGAQELRPVPDPFDPGLEHYSVALIRSDRNGDRIVAQGAVGGDPVELPTREGESFIYAPGVQRIVATPPGEPGIFQFSGLAAVPNASWKHMSDPDSVETLLNVQPIIVQVLFRDADGLMKIAQYKDLRAAQVDVDGETVYFVWDQVAP